MTYFTNNINLEDMCFQQDGTTPHFANESIKNYMVDLFEITALSIATLNTNLKRFGLLLVVDFIQLCLYYSLVDKQKFIFN